MCNGVYNIPGYVLDSGGFGYAYKTYCCKNCGEIFVLNLELLFHLKTTVEKLSEEKSCPACNENLQAILVGYPENILHEGKFFKNTTLISRTNSETELLEVYELK
jgi:hypothetical protein